MNFFNSNNNKFSHPFSIDIEPKEDEETIIKHIFNNPYRKLKPIY